MKKTLAFVLAAALLMSLLPAGLLLAETENSVINMVGARAGYSIALLTEPDKIPVLVIRPGGETRLQGMTFELHLTNAYWDLETYGETGIENYGDVNAEGEFTPVNSPEGYLTGARNPQGLPYVLKAGERNTVATVTLDPSTIVTSFEALYIPLLTEVTGNLASVELYDPVGSDISITGSHTFASSSLGGGITTQVRPGPVKEFSQTAVLSDLTINELEPGAMVGSTLTLTAPAGYHWLNLDQIQISGRNTTGVSITSREYGVQGVNSTVNRAVAKLNLVLSNTGVTESRAFILRNLQIAADEGNSNYGSVSVTLSGCNMEQETVKVANRVRVDYIFSAESQTLPKLIVGNNPADPVSESLRTLKVTLEESVAGRWRADNRTTFTLPAGVTARAVLVNTSNLAADLPKDTLIQRIDENAYALNTENSGVWTLASNGLTVQNAKINSGNLKARVELTFYISANEGFSGQLLLTAGGSALTHELTAVIAEAIEKPEGPAVSLTIGSKEIKAGAETIVTDVAPYLENGFTMVPVSYVAKALGLPEDGVKWDPAARTVTVNTGSRTAVLTIDSKEITVDGVTAELAAAPVIKDGRTFLPFRALGEQVLGVTVRWDSVTRTASFQSL